MTRTLCVLAGLAGLGALPAAALGAPPPLMRIVILDTSGSMAGERLDTARKEVLDVTRQLPPSATHPVVVVPFHSAPHDVRTFTDLPSLESYLGKLKAEGGTSIASGLERAIQELKSYADARHVCVMLYTDGEDGDLEGIRKQEEQLDKLFASRGQRGLQQTMVFCKRWEGANADLLGRVSKRGHARVIDAGELRLTPVTFTPAVEVSAARWSRDVPGALEVELRATVEVKGKSPGASFPAVRLSCRTTGVTGDVAVEVQPGGAASRVALRVPVSDGARAAGRTELAFDVACPGDVKTSGGLVLPQVTADQIHVPVDFPRAALRGSLKASATPGPAAWADPLRGRPSFPLTLTLDVQSPPDQPWAAPVSFGVTPGPGCRVAAGGDGITLTGPGPARVPLTVEVDQAPAVGPSGKVAYQVTFTVAAKDLSPGDQLDPPEARIALFLDPPAGVQTRLSVQARAVGSAAWSDLARGIATFEADVEFRVDGPLAADTAITVRCPPGVCRLGLTPGRVTTGVQIIRFAVEARLPPGGRPQALVFQVDPPPPQGAVQVVAPPPLRLTVAGPQPVRLALRSGSETPLLLRVSASDSTTAAGMQVEPVVIGPANAGAARGLEAVLRGTPSLKWQSPPRAPLYAPLEVGVGAPDDLETSFFCDSVVEGDIEVTPSVPTPAVVGSRQHVVLQVEAPFKRLLFYLVASVAAILAAFSLGRMCLRITSAGGRG